VSDATDIPDAVERIKNDYDMYRRGAFECFLEHYDISKHLTPFVSFVESLKANPTPRSRDSTAWPPSAPF
jgi:hypothetical protein